MTNGKLFLLGLVAALAASALRPVARYVGLPV